MLWQAGFFSFAYFAVPQIEAILDAISEGGSEGQNLKLCSWALFIALRVSAFFRASHRAVAPLQFQKADSCNSL
jgi:hypothetical protein